MSAMPQAAFDSLAERYDELWTNTAIGRIQRDAVWHCAGDLFHPGDRVLDLGCGTGEDASLLAARGVHVTAIDASPAMVAVARRSGIDAHVIRIEDIASVSGQFDAAYSNFGPLNCVEDLSRLSPALGSLIRRGGHLVLCILGRFCLWETIHFALRAKFPNAARRWRRGGVRSSLGVKVFYPSVARVRRDLLPGFHLIRSAGVGIFVPPSYVTGISPATIKTLGAIDRRIATLPIARAVSDHRLLVFQRS